MTHCGVINVSWVNNNNNIFIYSWILKWFILVRKTNKYQLTENTLQLHNATKLYTNTTTANFTRPVSVFDKSMLPPE